MAWMSGLRAVIALCVTLICLGFAFCIAWGFERIITIGAFLERWTGAPVSVVLIVLALAPITYFLLYRIGK